MIDGVRGKNSCGFHNKELEGAFGGVQVDCRGNGSGGKAKEVKQRFVWMALIDDPPNPNPNPNGNHIGLFF